MADGPSLGTGYLRVAGDFSQINAQAVGLFSSSKWKNLGKVAGVGLAAGLAAGGAAKILYDIGAEFDDADDKIRTTTGKTGKSLARLQQNFRNVVGTVPADIGSVGDAVAGLNQRLDLSGKPLERMSKQILQLSKVTDTDLKANIESVSKAFQDWDVPIKQQRKTLDGFFRLSQETGITVDELAQSVQQFGSPLRQLGFTLGESASMFAQFEKAGVNTQTMVPGLKLAISNLTRPTEELGATMENLGISVGNPEKALQQIFDLLGNQSTLSQIDKTGLAMDTFGKRAGADMAEAIRQGRFDVEDLLDTFRNGDDTIAKSERSTRDFSEQWQMFADTLKKTVEPVASKVFDGLGDLMKDVTKGLKQGGLSGALDVIVQKLRDAIPRVVETGLKIGGKLAGAILKGISDLSLGTKLVGVGAILAWFGGKAAFEKAALGAGTLFGKTFGKGTALGLALAIPLILDEWYKWVHGHREAVISAGLGFGEDFVNGIIEALNRGIEAINQTLSSGYFTEAFGALGVDLNEAIEPIGKVSFDRLEKSSEHARKALLIDQDKIRAGAKSLDKGLASDLGNIGDNAIRDLGRAGDAGAKLNKRSRSDLSDVSKNLDKTGDSTRDYSKTTAKEAADTSASYGKLAKKAASGLGHVGDAVNSADDATGKGLQNIGDNLNSLLSGMKIDAIKFSIKAAKKATKEIQGLQQGGAIVPGTTAGDSVPLFMGNQHVAMVEPGELVSVANRNATAALMKVNANVPRFASGGVIEQALGPYSMGPIQYDQHHAGGNSHLHLDFFTAQQAQAYGHRMQGMGWTIGEYTPTHGNPYNFGGISTQHQSPGHYDGSAFDANTAEDETKSQVAAVVQLLGGKGVAGAVAEKIKRVLLQGPDGPLKSAGQTALDRSRSAANKYISDHMPRDTAGAGGPMIPGPPIKSLPENLKKWNVQYPFDSSESMPYSAIQALAAWQHLPDWFWKISIGESTGQPGAVGYDDGGTMGYGLYQETTTFADPYLAKLGYGKDYKKWLNPVINTMSSKLHFDAAASQTPNTPGFPWYGTTGLQRGGVVQHLAKGGLVGTIDKLFGILGKAKTKQYEKPIQAEIDKLTRQLKKKQKRQRSKKLDIIDKQGAMKETRAKIADGQAQVNSVNDAIAGLELADSFTTPREIEEILGQIGVDSDADLWTLSDDQRQLLESNLDADWSVERSEVAQETLAYHGLLQNLMDVRATMLTGLDEAKKRVKKAEAQIAKAKKEQKKAEDEAKKIAREIEKLKKKLEKVREENPPKPFKGFDEMPERKKNESQKAYDARVDAWKQKKHHFQTETLRWHRDKRNRIDLIGDRIGKQRFHLEQVRGLAGFQGRVIATAKGNQTSLDEFTTDTLGELESIQGVNRSMDPKVQAKTGDLFTFGGQIRDTIGSLMTLGAEVNVTPSIDFTKPEEEETAGSESLTVPGLMEFAKAVRLGVFDQQILPKFHTGGWVVPPAGQGEMDATLSRGEYVLKPEVAAAAAAGAQGGDMPPVIEVYIGGEKIDERVDVRLRRADRASSNQISAGSGA